jgi:flagellar biogenesis protein FliO
MKRLSVALAFFLFVPLFSSAQSQTGNASYNSSKTGSTISHSSLSFNTRVKVTNLRNSHWVEAVVDGRINPSPERIADISRDAGDALGMAQNGMTLVEIEVLHPVVSAPAPAPTPTPVPEPSSPAPEPRPAQPAPAADPAPAQAREQTREPPAQIAQVQEPPPARTVTEFQYVPVPTPYPERSCCATPFLLGILILFILLVILLVVILILLVRRFPYWWRWPRSVWFFRHSVWFRRQYRYAKKRRRGK